jgi:hypothetical protein
MEGSAISIGAMSYALGAIAFFLLSVPLCINWRGRLQGTLLLVACVSTIAWTAATAAHYSGDVNQPRLIAALEVLRGISWVVFLGSMLYPRPLAGDRLVWAKYLVPVAILCLAVIVAVDALYPEPRYIYSINPRLFLGLATAVIGILLTENLFRSASTDERWHVKFLCLSTGAIFAYDLFMYADATLFGGVDPVFQEARGGIQALTVPRPSLCWRSRRRATGCGGPISQYPGRPSSGPRRSSPAVYTFA